MLNRHIVLASLLLCSGLVMAEDAPPPKDGHPPQPPQAAIDACSGKAAEDSCESTMPDGKTMAGICSAMPGNSTLVCGPKGGMKPPHGAPNGQPPAPPEE